jgi:hypothetical protein
MRRAVFAAVCIFALLIAQFGALTHAAWHAHAGQSPDLAHGHDYTNGAHEDEHPSSQADLCAFDLAFGQVLGGVHAGGALPLAMSPGAETLLDVPASRLRAEALAAKSRGPPVLL